MQEIISRLTSIDEYLSTLDLHMPKAYPVEMAKWMLSEHTHYSGQIAELEGIAAYLEELSVVREQLDEAGNAALGRAGRSCQRMLFALRQVADIDLEPVEDELKIAEATVAVGGYSTDFVALARSVVDLSISALGMTGTGA